MCPFLGCENSLYHISLHVYFHICISLCSRYLDIFAHRKLTLVHGLFLDV